MRNTCLADTWLTFVKILSVTYKEADVKRLFSSPSIVSQQLREIHKFFVHPGRGNGQKKMKGSLDNDGIAKKMWQMLIYGYLDDPTDLRGEENHIVFDHLTADRSLKYEMTCGCVNRSVGRFSAFTIPDGDAGIKEYLDGMVKPHQLFAHDKDRRPYCEVCKTGCKSIHRVEVPEHTWLLKIENKAWDTRVLSLDKLEFCFMPDGKTQFLLGYVTLYIQFSRANETGCMFHALGLYFVKDKWYLYDGNYADGKFFDLGPKLRKVPDCLPQYYRSNKDFKIGWTSVIYYRSPVPCETTVTKTPEGSASEDDNPDDPNKPNTRIFSSLSPPKAKRRKSGKDAGAEEAEIVYLGTFPQDVKVHQVMARAVREREAESLGHLDDPNSVTFQPANADN